MTCYQDKHYAMAIVVAIVIWITLYFIDSPVYRELNRLPIHGFAILNMCLISPILEEIIFRGMFQGRLITFDWGRKELFGVSGANVLVSMLFASLHVFHYMPLMAFFVFFPSLIFGYFRDRYHGALTPSILLHCFYNTGHFLFGMALIVQD